MGVSDASERYIQCKGRRLIKAITIISVSALLVFYLFWWDPYEYQAIDSSVFEVLGEGEPVSIKSLIPGDWNCLIIVGPYSGSSLSYGGISLEPIERYGMDWNEHDWLLLLVSGGEITTVVDFEAKMGGEGWVVNQLDYFSHPNMAREIGVIKGEDAIVIKRDGNFDISPGDQSEITTSCE